MRRRSIAAAAAALVGSLWLSVPVAHACSCAFAAPRERLDAADAAFVGVLESERAVGPGGSSARREIDRFRVEQVYKGRLGGRVEVATVVSGASCGLEVKVGQRAGLLLRRDRDGRWHGGLCDQIAPDDLRDAARPLPAPSGAGRARLLLGGPFGNVSAAALDSRARVLGYGRIPTAGRAFRNGVALAPCPGGRRVVEAFGSRRQAVVRSLPGMRRIGSLPLDSGGRFVGGLSCRDARGTRVIALVVPLDDSASRLVAVRRGRPARVLLRGRFQSAVFAPGSVLLDDRNARRPPVALDLRSGKARALAVPAMVELAVSPDGRRLAGHDRDGRVLLVDRLRSNAPRVHRWVHAGRLEWASPRTLVADGNQRDFAVLDARLRVVRRIPAPRGGYGPWAAAGGRLFVVRADRLYAASARRGRLRLVGRLALRGAGSLVAVGPHTGAARAASARCPSAL